MSEVLYEGNDSLIDGNGEAIFPAEEFLRVVERVDFFKFGVFVKDSLVNQVVVVGDFICHSVGEDGLADELLVDVREVDPRFGLLSEHGEDLLSVHALDVFFKNVLLDAFLLRLLPLLLGLVLLRGNVGLYDGLVALEEEIFLLLEPLALKEVINVLVLNLCLLLPVVLDEPRPVLVSREEYTWFMRYLYSILSLSARVGLRLGLRRL